MMPIILGLIGAQEIGLALGYSGSYALCLRHMNADLQKIIDAAEDSPKVTPQPADK